MSGAAMLIVPFALGFGVAGILASVALGATLMGLGLASAGSAEGRPPLAVDAHAAYDHLLAIVLLLTGAVLGLMGDVAALAVLVPLGLAELLLKETTRYAPIAA